MFIKKANYINTIIKAEDKSTYQTHNKLAEDIVSYIKETHKKSHNNEKTLPQIIGLEGPWGSGKSNLVKLIKNKFENEKRHTAEDFSKQNIFVTRSLTEKESCTYHDFIFNIWENQSTSIENAFLKYLLDDLILNKILTGKTTIKIKGIHRREKWTDIFDIFTAKKQYEKSFLWGTLIIFAFLLAFFIKWFEPSNINFALFANYSFLFVVFLLFCLICSFSKNFTTPFRLFPLKSAYTEVSTVGLYSEDFKNLFNNISRELQKQNKILIINFDNIDRCNNEKAQEVLSLIYTVFSEYVYKNIWVILTYDYDKLAEVILSQQNTDIKSFQKGAQEEQSIEGELENTKVRGRKETTNSTSEESQENAPVGTQRNEDFIKYNYVDGFLNKILPVIYKVPANITLDYKNVFDSYFNEAFEEFYKKENENEVNISLDKKYIYKLYRTKHKELIYRDIISFINQLVLYRNRQDIFKDIDLFTIAVYILYEKELKQVKDILSYKFSHNITILIYEYGVTNINIKLATILYQIDLEKALQLQIFRTLENEITLNINTSSKWEIEYDVYERNKTDLIKQNSDRRDLPKDITWLTFSPRYALSNTVFSYIKEKIFPSCWISCCEDYSTEYLMRGIVTWCQDYEDNIGFQILLDKVAEFKVENDKDLCVKNINALSFYTYLILFRYLKNKDFFKKLLDLFDSNVTSIKQNLHEYEENITYIWLLSFILVAVNKNLSVNNNTDSRIDIDFIKEPLHLLIRQYMDEFFDYSFDNYELLENSATVNFLNINFEKFFLNKFSDWNKQLRDDSNLYGKLEEWVIKEKVTLDWNNSSNVYNEQLKILFHIFDFIEKCKKSYNFCILQEEVRKLLINYNLTRDSSIYFLGSLCRFYRQIHNTYCGVSNILKQRIINNLLLSQLQYNRGSNTSSLTKEYLLSLLEMTVIFLREKSNSCDIYDNFDNNVRSCMSFSYQIDSERENFIIKEINRMLTFWIDEENKKTLKKMLTSDKNVKEAFPKNSLFYLIAEALYSLDN